MADGSVSGTDETSFPVVEDVGFAPSDYNGQAFICGGIASIVGVFSVFPLYKTIFFQQLHGISWWEAVRQLKSEGMSTLYRGALPPLIQRSTNGSLMFGVQNHSEKFITEVSQHTSLPAFAKITMSAWLAACVEATIMPFERIQTILQISKHFSHYRNTLDAVATIYRVHGIFELYRGLSPVLLRNCLGNTLYFSGIEEIDILRKRCGYQDPSSRYIWNFVGGGLLGASVGVICFPMNVVKTRMQSKVGGKFGSVSYTLKELVSERGKLLRLYRGAPVNFVRSLMSWGIITMTYRELMKFM